MEQSEGNAFKGGGFSCDTPVTICLCSCLDFGTMTRRKRLAELMEDRRLDLMLTWQEVADAAGITTETLRQIRFGTAQIQKLKQRGVEEALAWQPGGIAAFLTGGDPPSPVATPVNAIDRVGLRVHGMTAAQLYMTVVRNKAIALSDRAAFVRAVVTTIEGPHPEQSVYDCKTQQPEGKPIT